MPIRRAVPDDLETTLALPALFHAEDGIAVAADTRREALAALLADPRLGGVWLSLIDDHTIGYVALCHGWSLELGGRDAFIDELFVLPEHRGRGLGGALLTAAIEAAEAADVRAFHLEIADGKPEAQGLYRKLGFQPRPYRLMTRASA